LTEEKNIRFNFPFFLLRYTPGMKERMNERKIAFDVSGSIENEKGTNES
jgi:hypothetical protein